MLVLKFAFRRSKITWIVNDNWIMLCSFLLTMLLGVIYRRSKKSSKNIKMPHPKGGEFIDECFEPDSIYELVDPSLEIVVKQMLNLPPESGPLVISVPLLILAYIASREPIKQITILGFGFYTDKLRDLAIKTGIGIVSGSIFFFIPVGVVSLTSVLITGALIFNVARGINDVECHHLVSKVPMERVSQQKAIGFLETIPEKTPKVFIKDSEDTELYIPNYNANGSCSSNYIEVKVTKSTVMPAKTESQTPIYRKCEREYVPLKYRTKTFADLKKLDSTETREKAEPYIKRYEDRRKRIMNERVE